MKQLIFGLSLVSVLGLASCIQDEPLNSECDIEQAIVVTDDPEVLFFNASQKIKNVSSADSVITFYVRNDNFNEENLKNIPIQFKLTPGATIIPENGSIHDFSLNQSGTHYRVTSEDGKWHRDYRVRFALTTPPEGIMNGMKSTPKTKPSTCGLQEIPVMPSAAHPPR